MTHNTKPVFRLHLLGGYLAILGILMACSAVPLASTVEQAGILQLDDGIVKVQNQNGNWEPLAGTSTFELVGTLETMNPWVVTGKTLMTNSSTQIAQGLQVGNLVRVRGTALEDGNWLAYSIEPATEQSNQTVTLIGKVTSVNPWVVNGLNLNVTDDTVITGEIQPGMLVQVEILLQQDGTWEVLSITPLGNIPTASGCATVIATIATINGNQIQFVGWPTSVTVEANTQTVTATSNNDDEDDENPEVDLTNLKPGQQLLVVVCAQNDQLVITKITVLTTDTDDEANGGEKVLICHKPAKKGGHTISVSSSAVPAHLGHGDKLGACP